MNERESQRTTIRCSSPLRIPSQHLQSPDPLLFHSFIINHRSGTEVLARRLIGTCAQINNHDDKGLVLNKRKDKVKINLADGTTRESKTYVKQACISFEEHMEFIDFTVINIPQYEAILGKRWLDRWNPAINWKENSLQWKMGKRTIKVAGVSDAHCKKESFKFVSKYSENRRNISSKNEEIS